MQSSRQGLTRVEQRDRITSLDLLAMLLLTQPRISLAFWAASAHCWLMSSFFIHQYPQVFLGRAALNPLIPQPVLIPGVALTQVQDLALGPVEPHEVHMGPLLQLVQVPLDGILSLSSLMFFFNDRIVEVPRLKRESQNCIGWKRPLRSSSPTVNLTLPRPPLYHVHKHLIQTSFKYFQGWRLNHFPGQPVPMLDNPFSEVKFPNIQSKPPLVQLEAISSRPSTCYLGEETDPHLATTSFQVVVESNKVSPQPPFLQAKQPQLPQTSAPDPSPASLPFSGHAPAPQCVQILNTVFEVWPHQCRVQGHNHFPSPAGHAIFDTSQDAIGFLGCLGTLLAHIQAAVNQYSQVLLCWAAFQPLFPKPVALHGVAVAQVQDLALGLVKPHTIDLSPLIQPSLPTLKQTNTPAQLGVICKLTEGALDPFIQIIDKDIKQNWPQHRALGNTTCDRPPAGVNSIHHNSLGPAIQPVLYPAKSTPMQAMSSQFLQENAVGNCVKGFTEVEVDNIHSLSLIH
ncbi:hypothetical protein QYF61_027135 [Mycteria americana]|uniref:Uncharacterized protein n=1 Tax=Mycteria americana TaxID=33587 RepID=A0AAN7N8I0_MYCAM|nr:hypothetical protein QYF61_027135 [Mycteria americana]